MAVKVRPKRRAFSIGDQLLAKLGPGEYGALLDGMQRAARPTRRRRRRRKAVAS